MAVKRGVSHYKPRVFENEVLKKIIGTQSEEVQIFSDVHNFIKAEKIIIKQHFERRRFFFF